MEDYEERVIVEKSQLDEKLVSLISFMRTTGFVGLSGVEQGLLMVQLVAMKNYSEVLRRRIEAFK